MNKVIFSILFSFSRKYCTFSVNGINKVCKVLTGIFFFFPEKVFITVGSVIRCGNRSRLLMGIVVGKAWDFRFSKNAISVCLNKFRGLKKLILVSYANLLILAGMNPVRFWWTLTGFLEDFQT